MEQSLSDLYATSSVQFKRYDTRRELALFRKSQADHTIKMKKILSVILVCIVLLPQYVNAQRHIKAFATLQGSVIKYVDDKDPIFGGSLSGGILVKKRLGLAANLQAMEWGSQHHYYMPVNFEASYQTKPKIGPYFSLQIGKGIYKGRDVYSIPTFTSVSTTTGGLYFSPGAGILFPFFGRSKALLTASYIRSQFTREIYIEGDPARPYRDHYNLNGWKVGLGFMLR